jgi:hypothetical protein
MSTEILVIKISSRRTTAIELQKVFTEFGCSIKARLGLHEAGELCSDEGILILQLTGEIDEIRGLQNALNKMPDIKAKLVEF